MVIKGEIFKNTINLDEVRSLKWIQTLHEKEKKNKRKEKEINRYKL